MFVNKGLFACTRLTKKLGIAMNQLEEREMNLYLKIHSQYINELKSMFDFHNGRLTQKIFEPQWILLPFYWFMKDYKRIQSYKQFLKVGDFVDETVNILSERYNITINKIEKSHIEKGYNKIINDQPLFKTVLEIEETRFFEDYEKLKKMKKSEQKLVDTKLQVLNLYTSTKNILNSSVLNVASYMNALKERPKVHRS